MYNSVSSNSGENEKTDNWSFSFDYQRFSNKNKPKSLLGRRTAITFPQENETVTNENKVNSAERSSNPEETPQKFQNLNRPALTYPVNPKLTPLHNFPHPANDSQQLLSEREILSKENKGKSCQRGLGFSTPFKLKETRPLKDISCTYDQVKVDVISVKCEVNGGMDLTKDLSSMFVNGNRNKDLNTSFICEDNSPLPGDYSKTNETKQINFSVPEQMPDLSTEDINNSCFMTAHEINSDLSLFKSKNYNLKTPRSKHDSTSLKTPCGNFSLFNLTQSPVNLLAGILCEENESFNSDNSMYNTSSSKSNESHDNAECSNELPNSAPSEKLPFSCGNEMNIEVGERKLELVNNNLSLSTKTEMLSLESVGIQSELIKISDTDAVSHRNNQREGEITLEQQNTAEDISTKLPFVVDINQGSTQFLNKEKPLVTNECTLSTSITKDPTVIANKQKNNLKQSSSLKNGHTPQVPTDRFINSRLMLKPQPQNILYVNDKPYAALSLLGRGGSSEVFQVLEENSTRLMAIKCVNLATVEDSTASGYLNEIELLSKLQGCPSVIKMFDHEYVESTKMLYVVMEKGDIDFSKLMKDITKIKKIPMSMIIYYWTEILNAVKDIHDKGVIHTDLKPGNFLLVSGRLKLIDFGIASSLQGDMTSVERDIVRGTFNYISPEAITAGENRCHKINYKSDVWSLGCILYNLLFGCTPFSHITSTLGKFQAIADPNFKVKFPKSTSHVPPALKLSVRWCLIKDAKSRPTVDRLLKLSEHAIRVPQIDSLWFQYVIKEFPDCCISLEDMQD